jgi:DNA-binding NtrC family response regulator
MKSILVVSEKKDVVLAVHSCFSLKSSVKSISNKKAAIDVLQKKRYDFIFIDLELFTEAVPNNRYKEALRPFWSLCPTIEMIIMTPETKIREAVKLVKAGASDYIIYPINPEEANHVIDNIIESQIVNSELDYLRDKFWAADSLKLMYSTNPLMKTVYEKLRAVAPTKSTVLLTGETGTGKNVLAKFLHKQSSRRDSQFISVHCGAIPDTLLESELFGHEKGAFTGAVRRKPGKFEIAGGGTILLDEIGTITPSAQIKLLQVLQDGTFQRVGGEVNLEADVRVITATNVDLKKMCDEGRFRRDLYYRLNVFPIEIPPLKDRMEDIPYLVERFIKKLNMVNAKNIYDIDPRILEAFSHYSWPGNIRELENLIERAYILETSHVLTPESFPSELFEFDASLAVLQIDSSLTLAVARKKGIENIERNYLKALLTRNMGKINDSAVAADITTRQLHKLMAKYGLCKEAFKPPKIQTHKKEL